MAERARGLLLMAARGSLHAAEPAACHVETYLPLQGAVRLAAADPVDMGVVGSTGFFLWTCWTHTGLYLPAALELLPSSCAGGLIFFIYQINTRLHGNITMLR